MKMLHEWSYFNYIILLQVVRFLTKSYKRGKLNCVRYILKDFPIVETYCYY